MWMPPGTLVMLHQYDRYTIQNNNNNNSNNNQINYNEKITEIISDKKYHLNQVPLFDFTESIITTLCTVIKNMRRTVYIFVFVFELEHM